MTVIAWDGKTLAADKLALFGPTKQTVTKIFRSKRELLAVSGSLSSGMEMIDWYCEGARPADFPASNRNHDSGSSLIVVREDATVIKYESGPSPFVVEGRFCAFGNGDESAMIAMECGKSAKEAVEIVSKYNNTCGNGIDALDLR